MKTVQGRPPVTAGDVDDISLLSTLAEVAEGEEEWEVAAFYYRQIAKEKAEQGDFKGSRAALNQAKICDDRYMAFANVVEHVDFTPTIYRFDH